MQNKISFAITVCNEHEELNRLLKQLTDTVGPEHEIIVQGDQGNVTDTVVSVLRKYMGDISYIEYPLNKNFAAFKNNLFKNCKGDYIFSLDADEYLSDVFLENIMELLDSEPDVDCFAVPRKNTVEGITQQYVKQMGWKDENGIVNWPDYQKRLFKNNGKIKFYGNVHEQLFGMEKIAYLPTDTFDWCLIHPKTFERQKKQNELYAKIA
jgi:glycosyltransferase involved in cell wall biosynthesis